LVVVVVGAAWRARYGLSEESAWSWDTVTCDCDARQICC
jgi:hypothetical protein